MLAHFRKYKLPILTVALVILTTSIGFSIDMHYCQGNLKNISLVGDAQTCAEKAEQAKSNHCAKKQMTCHKTEQNREETQVNHKNCCSNNLVSVQLDENFVQSNSVELNNLQVQFIIAYISNYLIVEQAPNNNSPYKNYKPPLLDKDIPILTQTFLC